MRRRSATGWRNTLAECTEFFDIVRQWSCPSGTACSNIKRLGAAFYIKRRVERPAPAFYRTARAPGRRDGTPP